MEEIYMKKVFFFGAGFCAEAFLDKVKIALESLGDYSILGFLDNDENKIGTLFEGYQVYSPDILSVVPCDLILFFLFQESRYKPVIQQLSQFRPIEQIQDYTFPLKLLLQKKYCDSKEGEIKETLNYVLNHPVSVFNQFITADDTYDEVKWDYKADLPYIEFKTIDDKKVPMYYPRNYEFVKKDGGLFVLNLLWEQSEGSPHLYVKQNHNITEGDCVIDAGVCEGNFALKYAGIASHIYMFETDSRWFEPLNYTFRDYEEKVTIIHKAVSDETSKTTCKIDDAVSGHKVDFIKMDIEGAELSAIRGAQKTFCTNHVKTSVCSYHKRGDEVNIRKQLENYGYQTSTSNGYMLFLYSDDTWESGDLRRGIVYGKNCE
jgi:hypothetical protein